MLLTSRTIAVISLALSILSVCLSYRRKLRCRHLNLLLCFVMALTLLVCTYYSAIFTFLRDHLSDSAFKQLRGVLRVLFFSHSGVFAALETICLVLSALSLFATLATGYQVIREVLRQSKSWISHREPAYLTGFRAAEAEAQVLYLRYCSLLL